MTTVRSRTDSPLAFAIQRRFCVGVAVMSMRAGGLGADGDLVHVHARAGVEHGAPLADGDDGDGVGAAVGGERGAVDGVDGDVGERRGAVADALAVEQHGRFVLLAFADDDDAVHRHRGEHGAHGVDGGAIGAVLVAAADPPGGGECGRLGDTHQFEREVAVGLLRVGDHRCQP